MRDGKYHKAYGLPPGSASPWIGQFSLKHTQHSRLQCGRPECGGFIDVPENGLLEIDVDSIVEIEIAAGEPIKALVRLRYSDTQDIVLALCRPVDGSVICKTLWLNDWKDQHKTLKTAYTKLVGR